MSTFKCSSFNFIKDIVLCLLWQNWPSRQLSKAKFNSAVTLYATCLVVFGRFRVPSWLRGASGSNNSKGTEGAFRPFCVY